MMIKKNYNIYYIVIAAVQPGPQTVYIKVYTAVYLNDDSIIQILWCRGGGLKTKRFHRKKVKKDFNTKITR